MIRTNKGFTLIELMVVIVIIGILAALAIPKFTDASTKAKFAEIPVVTAGYDHAQLAYIAENSALGVDSVLVFDKPAASKWFTYDGATTLGSFTSKTGASKAVGPVGVNTLVTTSAITSSAVVTHTINATAATKYFSNF